MLRLFKFKEMELSTKKVEQLKQVFQKFKEFKKEELKEHTDLTGQVIYEKS
jgi:hypothetical protein